jgi:hypothetical protein
MFFVSALLPYKKILLMMYIFWGYYQMEKNEILVIYGNTPAEMAIKIAEAADLAQLIEERKKRIGLKPNLVV